MANSGRECAGLRFKSNTLEEIRAVGADQPLGPAGPIDGWEGHITVEVTPRCVLSEDLQEEIAGLIADRELAISVSVEIWRVERKGDLLLLTPDSWIEVEPCTGLRRESVRG